MNSSGNKNNSSNKSAFFDGLDEDDSIDAKSADLFVPRSSVKKLILKPNKNCALTLDDSSLLLNESNIININENDSLTLPSVKKLPVKTSIGKKHAFKKYDQFTLDTSCFMYYSSCAISQKLCYKNNE